MNWKNIIIKSILFSYYQNISILIIIHFNNNNNNSSKLMCIPKGAESEVKTTPTSPNFHFHASKNSAGPHSVY